MPIKIIFYLGIQKQKPESTISPVLLQREHIYLSIYLFNRPSIIHPSVPCDLYSLLSAVP